MFFVSQEIYIYTVCNMYKQLRMNPLQKQNLKATSTHLMCATQVLISFRIHIFLYERIIRLLPCQTIKQIYMQKNEQKVMIWFLPFIHKANSSWRICCLYAQRDRNQSKRAHRATELQRKRFEKKACKFPNIHSYVLWAGE